MKESLMSTKLRTVAGNVSWTACFGVLSVCAQIAQSAQASILPPNNLHLQDRLLFTNNISEQEFNAIVNKIINAYKPLVVAHGAVLKSNNLWSDSTVNASAEQSGNSWIINMYGGLARRSEVTPDGFAMVVCHELGHHLGGFAFYGDSDWASSEGQSDYFATQACAQKIWKAEKTENAKFRQTVLPFEQRNCDAIWKTPDEQNLCYRTVAAGQSLANLLSALNNGAVPNLQTPDATVRPVTQTAHPDAQCRLDTYFQGALCTVPFDQALIPGRNHLEGQLSLAAERVAASKSCTTAFGYLNGVRPRCWFAPKLEFQALQFGTSETFEISGNRNDAIEPGETIGVNFTLGNGTLASTQNVSANLSTTTKGIVVVAAQSTYPDIGSQESKTNDTPFSFTVDSEVKCGSNLDLKLNAKSASGSATFNKTFQVGKLEINDVGTNATALPIPDKDPLGVESVLTSTKSGSASRASVRVEITHAYPTDLKITLVAPDGKQYPLYPGSKNAAAATASGKKAPRTLGDLRKTFEVNLDTTETKGTWKLKLVDYVTRDSGILESWSLQLAKPVCAP